MRTRRKDIKSIESTSGRRIYELADGQAFYKTPKAYEIWYIDTEMPYLVKRFNSKNIGWVNTY